MNRGYYSCFSRAVSNEFSPFSKSLYEPGTSKANGELKTILELVNTLLVRYLFLLKVTAINILSSKLIDVSKFSIDLITHTSDVLFLGLLLPAYDDI